MAGLDLTQIKTELGAYNRANNKEVASMIYAQSQLDQFCKPISKIDGEFPAAHSVTTHVVQGFQSVWNAIGATKFKANILKTFKQKVNFEIIPADVRNSWLALLYNEKLKPEQMPISQYIMQKEVLPKAAEDMAYLEILGSYDENDLATFGKSMDGIVRALENGINDTENPMYRIRLNALTDDNIVDEVTKFEKRIPVKVKRSIKRIFMSTLNAERYMTKYEDLYGANTLIKDGDVLKSRLGKIQIVGLDYLNGYDHIFATPDGNMLKLFDLNDLPAVTDIQTLDYKVKIFMEWAIGYNFWMNPLVMVSTYSGTGSGLVSDNETYYGS
jgi:hypothetical protein